MFFKSPGRAAVAVGLITLAGASFVGATIVSNRDIPFPWDDGARACEGLRLARDMKAGDLISFLGDTYRQGWWGFFHSWLLAPAMLIAGPSYTSARLVSLACLVLLVFAVFLTALEFSTERGAVLGLMGAILIWTSLPFLVYAAMAMAEIPGAFLTFLTFWIYLRARRTRRSGLYGAAGVLMALTLFTAWHHGVFLVFAVGVTQISLEKKIWTRSNRSLFLPFLAIMIVWFAYPRHVTSFYGHSTFQPRYYRLLSLDNLLYYPRYFITIYHPTWLAGAALAAGFIASLRKIRNPAVRLLAAQVFIGLVLMTIKLDNRPRYIISIVPSIWLLGSSGLLEFAAGVKRRFLNSPAPRAAAAAALCGLAVLFCLSATALYRGYPDKLVRLNYASRKELVPVYEEIARRAAGRRRVAVFGGWDYAESPNSPTIRWHIELGRIRDAASARIAKTAARRLFGALVRERSKSAYDEFVRFLETKDVRVDEYHLLSFMRAADREAYDRYRASAEINPFSDKIVDPSALDPGADGLIVIRHDPENAWNPYVDAFLARPAGWRESGRIRFDDLRLTIVFLERDPTLRSDVE